MSDNIDLVVKGKKLQITIDLSKEGEPSKSGKSMVIASTHGNTPVPQNPDIKLGLNLYRSVR